MRLILVILILAAMASSGCGESCTEITETYPNGAIRTRVVTCKDSSYATYQSFYSNGRVWQVKKLVDGRTDGPVMNYDSLGHLLWKAYYHQGTLNGPYEDYFTNGHISTRSGFESGLQDGRYTSFYENCEVKSTANFKSGRQIGNFVEYYHNGNIAMIAKYEQGVPVYYVEYDSIGNQVEVWRADDADMPIATP